MIVASATSVRSFLLVFEMVVRDSILFHQVSFLSHSNSCFLRVRGLLILVKIFISMARVLVLVPSLSSVSVFFIPFMFIPILWGSLSSVVLSIWGTSTEHVVNRRRRASSGRWVSSSSSLPLSTLVSWLIAGCACQLTFQLLQGFIQHQSPISISKLGIIRTGQSLLKVSIIRVTLVIEPLVLVVLRPTDRICVVISSTSVIRLPATMLTFADLFREHLCVVLVFNLTFFISEQPHLSSVEFRVEGIFSDLVTIFTSISSVLVLSASVVASISFVLAPTPLLPLS